MTELVYWLLSHKVRSYLNLTVHRQVRTGREGKRKGDCVVNTEGKQTTDNSKNQTLVSSYLRAMGPIHEINPRVFRLEDRNH